jgi:hypothetical protein
MANPLAYESPAARLKQVGMLAVIEVLYAGGSAIALSTLAAVTGRSRAGAAQIMDLLLRRGVLA